VGFELGRGDDAEAVLAALEGEEEVAVAAGRDLGKGAVLENKLEIVLEQWADEI